MFTFLRLEIPEFLKYKFLNKKSTVRISSILETSITGMYENQYDIKEIIINLLEVNKEILIISFNNFFLTSFNSAVNYVLIKEYERFILE